MTRFLALMLTVLTGFTGLVYEVTWQKCLAVLLGSHAEATAAVLAIFLGGLAVGYSLFGRVSRRRLARAQETGRPPRLLLVYGGIEMAIGLWALAFPTLFGLALDVSVRLPFQQDPAAFAADVVLTALLIGPPTVLMGATIPLLTQALARSLADATRFHALVYGFNAGGAFVGALTAAFFLVPALGIPATLRVMGGLNLLAGAVFAVLGVRERGAAVVGSEAGTQRVRVEGFGAFAAAALLLGFAMMATQTVLIRVGGLSFGASHFTFAMVVAVFVLCISAGSLAVSLFGRIPRAAVVACPALLAGFLALLYPGVQYSPWAAHLVRVLFRDLELAFLPYYGASFLGILAVLAIPVGLSGASLPLLFHELRRVHGELGSVAGRLYSWNTVGNLLGALLGGYVLLYWLDLHHVYRLGVAAVVAAAGLLVLRLYPLPRGRRAAAVAVGLVVLAGLWALPGWAPERMSAGLFRSRVQGPHSLAGLDAMVTRTGTKVVFHDDDPTTTVTVKVPEKGDGRPSASILTNGKSDGSLIGDYPTMALVALLPCMIADSCTDAFVIGYGTGVTAGEFGTLDSIERVVVSEISRGVLEAAPLFDAGNLAASRNPKVHPRRSDAYRALLRSEGSFDVIASEPSNPWVSGVEMLFSREFLETARNRLRPGGVYAQWFHTYETDKESVALVLSTYAEVFDRVAVWYAQPVDLLLLGLMPEAELDLERMEQRFQRPDIAAGLRRAGITTFPQLLAHEALPLGVVGASALPDEVHTLLHPRLSDRAARAFFLGKKASLPPTAGVEAAEAGGRNSLLRAWIERQGGLTPELRHTLVDFLCPAVPRLCATVLARWLSDEPGSPELAQLIGRHGAVFGPRELETLARFFDNGVSGALSPTQATQATLLFGRHYHHGIPFDREALEATWRRCRSPDCWPAQRRAGRLLGDPSVDGAEAP